MGSHSLGHLVSLTVLSGFYPAVPPAPGHGTQWLGEYHLVREGRLGTERKRLSLGSKSHKGSQLAGLQNRLEIGSVMANLGRQLDTHLGKGNPS